MNILEITLIIIMLLMIFRMVNPFQKTFNLICKDPSEDSPSMTAVAL